MEKPTEITFDEFKKTWLENAGIGAESTLENGRRFARQLFIEWRQIDPDDADLITTDAHGDGGLDVSYLERGENIIDTTSEESDGDKYYLVQGKLGTGDNDSATIMSEFDKISHNLESENGSLSEAARNEFLRIRNFSLKADAERGDRLIWVFATIDVPDEAGMHAMDDVKTLGVSKFGDIFDVEAISLRTLFARLEESENETITLPLRGNLVLSSDNVLIGSVKLVDLYNFLESYRKKTGNLDQIFERNVRMFLGSRKKVNKQIRNTLENNPEVFGLYNNGITIVSSDFDRESDGTDIRLVDPYIVNGCQTTKTIHEVLRQRYDTGGHGEANDDWSIKIKQGNVLAKIVKTGTNQQEALSLITRYTNSQNAVSVKDFTALNDDVRAWKGAFESRYGIFLEIQRGAWNAQKTYERLHSGVRRFSEYENVFDLIKVYSSAWLELPGIAYGKNDPFAPEGYIFRKITAPSDAGGERIDTDSLYAAHILKEAADTVGFGRRSQQLSRKQSRYLFYYSTVRILKNSLRLVGITASSYVLTRTIINLKGNSPDALEKLVERATDLIDEYLTQVESTDQIARVAFEEPLLKNELNGDLNAFLKSPKLGKEEGSPNLVLLEYDYARILMGDSVNGTRMKEIVKEMASGE